MSYLLGIALAVASVLASLGFLDQTVAQYFDDVAIAIVLGGTAAVALIIMPWGNWRDMLRGFMGAFYTRSANDRELVNECLQYVAAVQNNRQPTVNIRDLPGTVLKDGWELITLRFDEQEIEVILQERVHQTSERIRKFANAVRSLSKYPPAFGLVGTVFGLVNLMRAITDGMDPSETGVRMAIALVATLYGLVVANMIIAPLGEKIVQVADLQRQRGEIAIHTVIMAAKKLSVLKAQEMLNSYVSPNKRVNFVGSSLADEAEAA